jgi:hypothetical protein
MKDDTSKHPGPWRVMQVDSEFAGILIAVGFVVLGLVGMPSIGTAFLSMSLGIGLLVAMLLRLIRND